MVKLGRLRVPKVGAFDPFFGRSTVNGSPGNKSWTLRFGLPPYAGTASLTNAAPSLLVKGSLDANTVAILGLA